MQTRAAIIRRAPGRFEVVDLEVDAPRRGEVQVRMVAAGLCHSDDHFRTGDSRAGHYPIVAGHEGAGVVEVVGPDTDGFAVGDHVVFSFIPSCGRCRWCAQGLTNLCDLGAQLLHGSRFGDPTSFRCRLADGTEVGQLCGLGTFSERAVVSVSSVLRIDDDLPLTTMCLLGCGVGTGWGSSVYAADVRPGEVVLVMGTGGVGINAVQGAAHAGARVVVAVDPVAMKREAAMGLGATHAFASMDEATDFVRSVTNGQGADKALVAVDVLHGRHVAQAVAAIRKAGTVVLVAVSASTYDEGIPVNPRELTLMQKRIQGAIFGACNPVADIPRQIEMYRAGQLELDRLVTRTYALDDVEQAREDMIAGRNIRGVITFDAA